MNKELLQQKAEDVYPLYPILKRRMSFTWADYVESKRKAFCLGAEYAEDANEKLEKENKELKEEIEKLKAEVKRLVFPFNLIHY